MNLAHSPPNSSTALLLHAALAVLLLGPLRSAAQTVPEPIAVVPCDEACGITLQLEMEYGDDSGPGILDLVGWVKGYRDVSGRTYIVGEPIDNVLVFDPDGRFLRRIGSSGSGPGELKDGSSLVVTGDGEFSVLDRGRGVILNFDHTGRLRSEVRTEGWVPQGTRTFAWDGSRVIHVANLSNPDRAGLPLHLVDVETGEIERSFGSTTDEQMVNGYLPGLYPLAIRQDRRIWMAVGFERYDIALWDMNRPHQLLRREASWFPEQTRDDLTHPGMGQPPRPYIYALALSEPDSLLWVAASVADEEWREADLYSGDDYNYYDDIFEVIDLRTNRVIASQRFDHSYHLVEAGLIGRLAITANGSVRYQTFRLRLEAAESAR